MPENTISVLVTYPGLYRGFAMPLRGMIGFGFREDYGNCSVSLLCHELLHCMTKNTRIMHALIALLVGNELRIRLTGKGEYFEYEESDSANSSPLYKSARGRMRLEKELYPLWKEYVKDRKGRTLVDLEEEMRRMNKGLAE